jgi:hypothetical protein
LTDVFVIDSTLTIPCLIRAEFAAARRALTTQLEQINVNGESYANYEKVVTRLYNDCMKAQLQHHRIYKKLRKVRPETAKPEDVRSSPTFATSCCALLLILCLLCRQ